MRRVTIKQFARSHVQKAKKRNKINLDIVSVVIDPVTALYLLPFIGVGLLVFRDALIQYQESLSSIGETILFNDLFVLGLFIAQIGLFKRLPILQYSSSERLMEYVTHKRRDLFCLLWIKRSLTYFILDLFMLGLLIFILPVNNEKLVILFVYIFVGQIALVIPRVYLLGMTGWRGSIYRFLIRIGVLGILTALLFSTGQDYVTLIAFFLLIFSLILFHLLRSYIY